MAIAGSHRLGLPRHRSTRSGVGANPAPGGWRGATVALGVVTAISALAGGVGLWGGGAGAPPELLDHTPFASFAIPAALLTFAVGGTGLVAAVLAWRRSRFAIDATFLAGGTLTVWIVAELAMMRGIHWLHLSYGALGLALLALGAIAGWRGGAARHRWIIGVTLAETLGFLGPVVAGVATARAGLGAAAQAAVMAAAGLFEGLVLGAGQASVMPIAVRRARFAALTAAGVGAVWLAFTAGAALLSSGVLAPVAGTIAAVVGGVVALGAIGGAQWLELRRVAPAAHRWIGWTALAWAVALPLGFTPGPFVDEATPAWVVVALWACAGALMAYVMATITWQGARRLTAPPPPPRR